jgi:hypothetical protein
MAALRALEKRARDAKAVAALAAPVVMAGIEKHMAADDLKNEENAAHPGPVNIPRVHRPIRRTHTFANLNDLNAEVEAVREG